MHCLTFSKSSYFMLVALHIFLFQVYEQRTVADGMKCVVILDAADKWEDANEQCVKSNKVDETKLEDASMNVTLEEFDFDDNCFIQCIYTKVGILSPEGTMDKKQTATILKGNMTAEMLEKTTKIWDMCIDEADKIAIAKKLNPCKKLGLHDFCFNKMTVEAGVLEMEC